MTNEICFVAGCVFGFVCSIVLNVIFYVHFFKKNKK